MPTQRPSSSRFASLVLSRVPSSHVRARLRSVLWLLLLGSLLMLGARPQGTSAQVPQESIHPGKTGQALIDALRADYTPSQTLGYGPARDELYRYLDTRDGVLIGVYGGYSVDIPEGQDPSSTAYQNGAGLSAEHTWPQSKGSGSEPQKSDMHHLYPVKQTINSARSNSPFDDVADVETDTWYIGSTSQSSIPTSNVDGYSERDGAFPGNPNYASRFEPPEAHKGNAARAVFYYYVVYDGTISDPNFFDAQKEELVEWHGLDAVDDNEYDRSQWIAGRQGTNNPFVLDTTLVRRAFGIGSDSGSPTVRLASATQLASEADGSATVTVQITNPDGSPVDVDLAFDPTRSTATASDVGGYTTQTVSFGSGAQDGDQQVVTVPLTDDADTETTETAIFALENLTTSGSTVLGSPVATEISILDDDGGAMSRLIISQYVETDSGTEPKGIELWNVSGAPIDFSTDPLVVEKYVNGAPASSPTTEFSLNTGTLGAGEVLVIGGSSLQTYVSANASGVAFYNDPFTFNGDDALEIRLGGTTEDVFGTIGVDPGSAWTGGGVSTAGQTIQLLSGIISGTPSGFSDPSTRFETVSTSPSSLGAELSGFGEAPGSSPPPDDPARSIVITEVMPNPDDVSDANGEYVELYNASESDVDVGGWTLRDDDSDDEPLTGSIVVPAGGYALLCKNADPASNGGLSCSGSFNQPIANSGDEVILEDGTGTEVDRVAYTSSWPYGTGAAMLFTGRAADDNSVAANWTTAPTREPGFDLTGGTDTGSPGGRNDGSLLPVAALIDGSGPGWRMFAPPVTGAVVGDLASQNAVQGVTGSFPDASPNVYVAYDGPGGAEDPQYWRAATEVTTELPSGSGFIWYLYDTDDVRGSKALPFLLSYTGASPAADVTTPIPSGEDWHLLGNPYPFAVPVNSLGLGSCQTTVQVWDPKTGTYVTRSGSDRIAAQQGFFAQCTGSTAAISFESDARTTTPTGLLKSRLAASNAADAASALVLRLRTSTGGGTVVTQDQAQLTASSGASLDWDRADASKLTPLASPYATLSLLGPDARSTGADERHVRRSLPESLNRIVEIPVQIDTLGTAGQVQRLAFDWPEVRLPGDWEVVLVDQQEDVTVNLRETSSYAATLSAAKATSATQAAPGRPRVRSPLSPQSFVPSPSTSVQSETDLPPTSSMPLDARFVIRITPDPLPVELTSLRATEAGQRVSLTWTTASETNNAGFEVQRRVPGAAYETIRFVEGGGTRAQPTTYEMVDADLPFADSLTYRLRQVDLDGTSTLSRSVTLQRPVREVELQPPFPNPARSRATIQYVVPSGADRDVRLDLYNLLGQRVATVIDDVVSPGRHEVALNTTALASGSYFLRLTVGAQVRTRRVVVVR